MAESDRRSYQSVINRGSTSDRVRFEDCYRLDQIQITSEQVMANPLNLDKVTDSKMFFICGNFTL